MVDLYVSPSCTSCRKARAWLEKHNIPLLRLPFWVIEKEEYGEKIQEFIDNLSVKSNELNN